MPIQIQTSTLEWNQKEICAVGDHVLLKPKQEQVKEPPEPTQQELVVNLLKKQDSQTQSVMVNSSERERCAVLMEREPRRVAKKPDKRSMVRSMTLRNTPARTQVGSVLNVWFSEDQGLMCAGIQSVVAVEGGKYCTDTCPRCGTAVFVSSVRTPHLNSRCLAVGRFFVFDGRVSLLRDHHVALCRQPSD